MPLPLVPIIAGISALGSLFNSYQAGQASAREAKRAQETADNLLKTERDTYLRDFYTPITQRSDVSDILRKTEEKATRKSAMDEARGIISGATPEVAANQAAARGKMYSDAISGISAYGQRIKDNATARYSQAQRQHAAVGGNMATNLAQSHAVAKGNALNAAVGAGAQAAIGLTGAEPTPQAQTQQAVAPMAKVTPTLAKAAPDMNPSYLDSLRNLQIG